LLQQHWQQNREKAAERAAKIAQQKQLEQKREAAIAIREKQRAEKVL